MREKKRLWEEKKFPILRATFEFPIPAKILSLFLPAAPLQHVPKMLFTQATIDYLATNEIKNALHNETVILNYVGGDPISHGLSN